MDKQEYYVTFPQFVPEFRTDDLKDASRTALLEFLGEPRGATGVLKLAFKNGRFILIPYESLHVIEYRPLQSVQNGISVET